MLFHLLRNILWRHFRFPLRVKTSTSLRHFRIGLNVFNVIGFFLAFCNVKEMLNAGMIQFDHSFV